MYVCSCSMYLSPTLHVQSVTRDVDSFIIPCYHYFTITYSLSTLQKKTTGATQDSSERSDIALKRNEEENSAPNQQSTILRHRDL